MIKNSSFVFLIIFILNCQGKGQEDLFPDYEFRNLEKLVGEEVIFSPFSIILPKGFKKFKEENLEILKTQLENDYGSYLSKELIHGFSDSLNTAIIISAIKDDDLLNKLDEDYRKYLKQNNEVVVKNQYSINNIRAVQYQIKNNINHIGLTNLKIFLINSDNENYLLDFIILDKNFSNKLYSIESSLSTLKRRK